MPDLSALKEDPPKTPTRGLRSSPGAEFVKYVNVDNAKKASFLLVTVFILYHGFIHVKYGNDSCKWLLSDGRFQGYDAWQPYGCMMHKYSQWDSQNCVNYISYWGGNNHIVFIGDSRIREQYFQFIAMLSNKPVNFTQKLHDGDSFIDDKSNLKVEFLWRPFVDDTMISVYKSWIAHGASSQPRFIVTGSATWTLKYWTLWHSNDTEEAFESYKANLTSLAPHFTRLGNSTQVLWMLQDPVVEQRLHKSRSMITNYLLDNFNKAAFQILASSGATIWTSSRLVAQGYSNKESPDGLHLSKAALEWDAQILMNMHCNDHMNFYDGTCCSSPEPISNVQIVTGVFFATCLFFACMMWLFENRKRSFRLLMRKSVSNMAGDADLEKENVVGKEERKPREKTEKIYELFMSLARLGLVMGYVFLCDRTNFFMKENKYYTHVNFFLPFSYLMILGFFFTENTTNTNILHRDQTDEWKGWMQLVILIYHLTGASGVLPIYMQIRVLVSSYIFMSGFGHFYFFWTKGQYSVYRFCQVMFRMNFLVIVLCFVMNRPYQFYYFVPLVSFWFLVIYLTMAIWPQVTASSAKAKALHYLYMILKLVALVVAISLLYGSEVFFEKVFVTHPIKALFVLSDDSLHEWRFRWKLDRFSTVFGMVFAFGLLLAKQFRLVDDNGNTALFSKGTSWLVGAGAICGLAGYGVFASYCRNKVDCNEVHSYIMFIPIVSFILLRNIPGWLRTRYSSFFAWFGKISLELFITQYHIWLAADTHGILVLVPSYPVLNIILTSFIFVCIAHEIHHLTGVLVLYTVPNDWKLLLRNFVCFIGILLPIAITHGAFGV